MIIYLLKTIACSAVFILLYRFVLENEKMHRFNRVYLLLTAVLSMIIPALPARTTIIPAADIIFEGSPFPDHSNQVFSSAVPGTTNYLPQLLITGYFIITILLLFRFIYNLNTVFKTIASHPVVPFGKHKVVLIDQPQIAHSFLNFIFMQPEEFNSGENGNRILLHESAHVNQKHSCDILFIELLLLFCWINPFFFLYRRAMRLNHEFLADEAVINSGCDTAAYQYLLINMAGKAQSAVLSSRFDYLITKKRLLMMTKTTSGGRATVKKTTAVAGFAVAMFFFSGATYSQVNDTNTTPQQKTVAGPGASQEMLNEYDSTLRNMTSRITLKNGKVSEGIDMRKCNIKRMAFLYKQMNKEQQEGRNKATGATFIALSTPPAKKAPAANQMAGWGNSKMYGVWIDGKRVANTALANYKASDFVLYYESRLSKNAVNYGKHFVQVDLYTQPYYDISFADRLK